MSRAASRSKRSRSTVMERGARDATPIRTSRAVSVSRTPLDVPKAAFAEQFAAPTAWSSVCVTRTPLHDNEAGLRYRDAAPNVRCGVRLRKLPLDSSGAELLRRHTAPEGWSGVLLLTLDRHPPVPDARFSIFSKYLSNGPGGVRGVRDVRCVLGCACLSFVLQVE